jgi:predicted peptidase
MNNTLFLFLTALALGAAAKAQTGYYKLRPTINADSAAAAKTRIIAAVDVNAFEPGDVRGSDNQVTLHYRLLRPANIDPQRKYPLVLVLHSSGTPIGTDNISQLGVLARLWAQPDIRKKYPAYVLVPQFPKRSSNYSPDPARGVLASVPDSCLADALHVLEGMVETYPVDRRRIYVVGFSMGGSSTINAMGMRPGLFAAGISISGIPDFGHLATLAQTPLWLIHGNADTENAMGSDSALYQELRARHDRQITFWEIEGLGHAIYPQLYTTDAIPAWLFSQRRKAH